MTPPPCLSLQNCQTFSSLSSLGVGVDIGGPRAWTTFLSAPGGRTPAGTPVPEPPVCREELGWEEPDGTALEEGPAWRGSTVRGSPCSLDGELDIEQIEQN